jgi:hypothetical protein
MMFMIFSGDCAGLSWDNPVTDLLSGCVRHLPFPFPEI